MVRLDKYGMPIRKETASASDRRPSPPPLRRRSRSPDRRRNDRGDDYRRRDDGDRRRSYDDRGSRREDDRRGGRRDEREKERERGPTTHTDRGELAVKLPEVPAGMPAPAAKPVAASGGLRMIEVIANDRLGGKGASIALLCRLRSRN